MTKREAAIISAYTGILLGSFPEMHKYVEEVMERPVFTHEMGDHGFMKTLQEKVKPDFIGLEVKP